MQLMFVTLCVSKDETSSVTYPLPARFAPSQNIPLMFVTLDVSNPERSRDLILTTMPNIKLMSVTLEVSNLETSRNSRLMQP